jgi:hypothetical protein
MSARVFTLQDQIRERITSDAFFNGIEILSLKKKELESDLEKRIASLSVAVGVFVAGYDLDPRRKGIHFREIRIQIGVVENRLANDTGKSAEEIVEKLCERLSGWTPACSFSGVPLMFDTPTVVEIPPETEADRKKRLIAVNFVLAGDIEESA